jgi:transposase
MSAGTGATSTTVKPVTMSSTKGGAMPDYDLYVGVDWATETHQVCCLDAQGQKCAEWAVPHSGAGLAQLTEQLMARVADPARIAVAIETPRGAVVDTLLDLGCHVFAVNPKQLDRFRDRHTVAGAKDDRRDAFVAADALRTDGWAFRRLAPEDPHLIQLREVSRLHEELTQERTRLSNRLREQLVRVYPQLLTLCPAANEAWVWTLLEQAPTPAQAQRLRLATLRTLLTRHRIRRFTADDLHTALQAPVLRVAPGTAAAVGEHVELLLPRLRLMDRQLKHCARRLDTLLDALAASAEPHEHRDVTILRSWPGLGRFVAATMLAEAATPLADRDYQTLRGQAGTAPVTRQSGKGRAVSMRYHCNRRLRLAVFHWARNVVRVDMRWRAHYDRLRQRHGYARALRGVADRLLGVLIAMLSAGTLYDPTRRRAIAA